jgi:hypothetical protein
MALLEKVHFSLALQGSWVHNSHESFYQAVLSDDGENRTGHVSLAVVYKAIDTSGRTQVILESESQHIRLSEHPANLAHLLQQPCNTLRGLSALADPVLDLCAVPFDSLEPARLELLAFVQQTSLRRWHDGYVLWDGVVCAHRVERLAVSCLWSPGSDDAVVDLLRRGHPPVRRQAQADSHGGLLEDI